MKITNSVEKNGYPQLIQDCNASPIKEILERVLHSITGKFDSAQKSTERTGNKSESTKIWGRYKTAEEDPTTEKPDKSGRIPYNLPD